MTDAPLRAFTLTSEGLLLLDQRALPKEERWLTLRSIEEVSEAIETLAVRGAPAIGGAAALALAQLARDGGHTDARALARDLDAARARLAKTRPTAVNLFFALERVREAAAKLLWEGASIEDVRAGVIAAAFAVVTQDEAASAALSGHGAALFEDGDVVLTICHTGALATCGEGTALGALKAAHAAGKHLKIIALETRPLLQGARLTAWECQKVGLDVTLITDGMVASALERLGVTKAITGADRIARNGDVANKIGTLGLARLCKAYGVPCYVAAPTSTFDVTLETGAEIPIEERAPEEVRAPMGVPFAPGDVPVFNPAFDVTPASLLAGIITERGVWAPPFSAHTLTSWGLRS